MTKIFANALRHTCQACKLFRARPKLARKRAKMRTELEPNHSLTLDSVCPLFLMRQKFALIIASTRTLTPLMTREDPRSSRASYRMRSWYEFLEEAALALN